MGKKDPLAGLTPGSREWQDALNDEIAKHDAEVAAKDAAREAGAE